jgi:indole-3-glycerol phosphate synthase
MAGAAAVSVLTDLHFDGKKEDIMEVASKISIPVLRKDFIIDEFQILEAKAIGASAILLIAAVLKKKEIMELNNFARKLELDVLLEIHEDSEIDKIPENLEIVGINNRNLRSFEVDLENSKQLAEKLPKDKIKVSESGIDSVTTLLNLYKSGFDAFLIGENFMKSDDPAASAKSFISDLEDSLSH